MSAPGAKGTIGWVHAARKVKAIALQQVAEEVVVAARLILQGGGVPVADGPAAFGEMLCAQQFPSPLRAVLDGSVYGQTRGQKQMTLLCLQGFASDAVSSVTLVGRPRPRAPRVPVVGNVYSLAHVPHGVLIVAISDGHGKTVARCGPNARLGGGGSYLAGSC